MDSQTLLLPQKWITPGMLFDLSSMTCCSGMLQSAAQQWTKITELQPDGERPVSATWVSRGGIGRQMSFDYLVDGPPAGTGSCLPNKHLRNRHFNKSLNNIACWGCWEGADHYLPGTRKNAVWIADSPLSVLRADATGWRGLFPFMMVLPWLELHSTRTSATARSPKRSRGIQPPSALRRRG
ncbi:hypothetical protein HD554DRAFT_1840711 [Boletus coccyginus]|nr:hypothetical protein HD554DRAFT_1840711 [Boletus coccyginus]